VLLLTYALSAFGMTGEGQTSSTDRALLLAEGFEDKKLASRGWYDGDRFVLSDDAVAGRHSISYHFPKGKLTPSDTSGVRRSFAPTDVISLRFHFKLSPKWSWTNKPYGPHLLHVEAGAPALSPRPRHSQFGNNLATPLAVSAQRGYNATGRRAVT